MRPLAMAFGISAGLASLTVSVLCGAVALGLVPDRHGAVLDGRKALCEFVAIHASLAAQRGDLQGLKSATELAVARNADVWSAAIREVSGKLVLEIGEHEPHWHKQAEDASTETHVQVPVMLGERPWGTVEFRFRPLAPPATLASLTNPLVPLAAFLAGSVFLASFVYLGVSFRRLHVGKPHVLPQRVRATLNTIVEGILVLDKEEKVVLANEAFAKIVGRSASDLQGRQVSEITWKQANSETMPREYPWTLAMHQATPLTGVILGLHTDTFGMRRVSVNATPIMEDGNTRGALVTVDDLTSVERNNAQLKQLLAKLERSRKRIRAQNDELRHALSRVKQLQGLLPICSYCKKIRDDKNYWQQVESYIGDHSAAKFSHGICPDCFESNVKPQLNRYLAAK